MAAARLMRIERLPPPSVWERFLARKVPMWGVLLLALLGAIVMIAFGALVRDAEATGAFGAAALDLAAVDRKSVV